VVRQPEHEENFILMQEGGVQTIQTYPTQQLLNLFINEMRRRAEQAVAHLKPSVRNKLRIGSNVRFIKAIFTHPVEINTEMKTALMSAAHAAGLNRLQTTPADFADSYCVDESTAAILAYCRSRLYKTVGKGHDFLETERVLSFDMGGGTLDISVMEVNGIKQYVESKGRGGAKVKITFCGKCGDNEFGGNDIDKMIAHWLLEQVAGQANKAKKAHIDENELAHALETATFTKYQQGAKTRAKGSRNPTSAKHLAAVWSKSQKILGLAEDIKKSLSSTAVVESHMQNEDWPTTRGKVASSVGDGVLKYRIEQERFVDAIRQQVQQQLPKLEQMVENAGWTWPELTTLMFTGQSVKVDAIRAVVKEFVNEKRGADADPLLVIEPSGTGFDPKRCVAEGAVLWANKNQWLEYVNKGEGELLADLEVNAGFFRDTIPGAEKGKSLPFSVHLSFDEVKDSLEIYRGDDCIRFDFPNHPCSGGTLHVQGAHEIYFEPDDDDGNPCGIKYLGKLES
jgi:molecular chaperone DnaK (HSP70)